MKILKLLGSATALGSADNVDSASLCFVVNTTTSAVEVTQATSGGSTIGTAYVPASGSIFIEKSASDTLVASASVHATSVAFRD
jgi:hypothetical protein